MHSVCIAHTHTWNLRPSPQVYSLLSLCDLPAVKCLLVFALSALTHEIVVRHLQSQADTPALPSAAINYRIVYHPQSLIYSKGSHKKMLENRPEDALVKLVKTVEIVETVKTMKTVETVETVETAKTVETVRQ